MHVLSDIISLAYTIPMAYKWSIVSSDIVTGHFSLIFKHGTKELYF